MTHIDPVSLGILQLGNTPMTYPGCLASPATFEFPVLGRFVPGAWVSNTVAGDHKQEQAWIDCARSLVADGAAAITSNCGFALRYQAAVAVSVPVPVSLSSLMLLPYLLRATPAGLKIAILTFDARYFDARLLALAGIATDAPVVAAGLEGTRCHEIMSQEDNPLTLSELIMAVADLAQATARLHPVGAFLFECAGFGPAATHVRQLTGKPVWDATDNARFLMAGVKHRTY